MVYQVRGTCAAAARRAIGAPSPSAPTTVLTRPYGAYASPATTASQLLSSGTPNPVLSDSGMPAAAAAAAALANFTAGPRDDFNAPGNR